jgi:hypothetical protein
VITGARRLEAALRACRCVGGKQEFVVHTLETRCKEA